MAHLGFAQRAPVFVLTGEESTQLATRVNNVLRHFDTLPGIPPWAVDAAFLVGTAGRIYIPRIAAMRHSEPSETDADRTQIQ
jgi:hypothetical protein